MPGNIKKFKLTYDQIPQAFSLPKRLYTQEIAKSIPEEVLEQTTEQQAYIAKTISQLELDSDRNCFVDFDGHKASALRTNWLTRTLDERPTLTKGVFPSFTQGDNTAESITEILYGTQFAVPLNHKDRFISIEVRAGTKKISFAYRTADGESAGLALIACPNGEHRGWIISTIQKTTAHPKNKKITILASANYLTSKAQTMVAMDNPKRIEAELKAAINNDKVSNLIQGIFNQDGSLNSDYLTDLDFRIQVGVNIDDRDRKEAQFNCLFELSQQIVDLDFQAYIASIKKQLIEDIDFFKNSSYEKHLKNMLLQFAKVLRQKTKSTKTADEIAKILESISERVANIEALAEQNYRKIELANTYKAVAKRISMEAAAIRFDGTHQDENKIVFLSQFDIALMSDKIEHFYASDLEVQQYFENKSQSYQKMQESLAQVPVSENTGFFSRNAATIGVGLLVGLLTTIAVVLALTGMLAPLSVILLATAVALVVTGATAGNVYINEQDYAEEVNLYHDNLTQIRLAHKQELIAAEQNLQKEINLDIFLEPDKPEFLAKIELSVRQPLTPEIVADALWHNGKDRTTILLAKNRFSLWAAKHDLDFGIKEVEFVIEQRYTLHV